MREKQFSTRFPALFAPAWLIPQTPSVSLLISVCHSYWFSKSLMLVKELITWIVAPLTPRPAAGFTAEALALLPAYPANHPRSISKSTRLARHAEKDVARRRSSTVTASYLHMVYGRLAHKKPASGRRIQASAPVLMVAASYSLLDK